MEEEGPPLSPATPSTPSTLLPTTPRNDLPTRSLGCAGHRDGRRRAASTFDPACPISRDMSHNSRA
eukprot:3151896-Pyramimonas_sp.AAC.1